MYLHYLEKPKILPIAYVLGSKRIFELTEDLNIQLSDGRWLHLKKGWRTDLMSVPKLLWSIIPPFDEGILGDIIHDALWGEEQKQIELELHGTKENAKKWSEYERKKWREAHAPDRKWVTEITHRFLRHPLIMKFYTREIKIPV